MRNVAFGGLVGALFVTAVFFVGLTLATYCATLSAERNNVLWHIPTVAYAVTANVLFAVTHRKPLDYVMTISSVLFLLVMGWAIWRKWVRDV